MSLQSVTSINIDFVKQEYLMINAKQYDDCSRFIYITCYNDGNLFDLNANRHVAYISFKKSDEHYVFNFCKIDSKGRILVELTEQMLAESGVCCAEIKVINKGSAIIDADTGKITAIDDASILSTMTFYVNVYEAAVDNSLIESSKDFFEFNDTLKTLTSEFTDVIQASKAWAIGDDGDKKYNNSKYYSELSKSYSEESLISEHNASVWVNGGYLEPRGDDGAVLLGEITGAAQYAYMASDFANSAAEYYRQMEAIVSNLNGAAFLPMGTISSTELATLKADGKISTGYLYNISNDFVSDDTFKNVGVEYKAGTNVYYTADGHWDCLVGNNIASVDEVKNFLGISEVI